MNILLIDHYAGSSQYGMEYRPFYLAREWVRLGHRVTIAAASFSHIRINNPAISRTLTYENIEGIEYIWLKTPEYKGNGVGRALNMLAFAFRLWQYAGGQTRECNPDLVMVVSTPPFVIFGARKIARKSQAKLIFEVRDLWPLTLVELGGISPYHPFIMAMQGAENFAYRIADRVVSLLPKAAGYMLEHGMAADKFYYLPNGIDLTEWQDRALLPQEHREVLNRLKQDGQFIVGYAGKLGLSNALNYLIEAGNLLKDQPVTLVLIGQGPEKKLLQEKAAKLGLTKVLFLPPLVKGAIPELLTRMDGLYIGWRREPLYRFGISPNKLMDYMMAAKPVIHGVEAGNDLVAESGCGISIPPEDAQAIAGAVLKLMGMEETEREAMGLRGRQCVLEKHDYRVLAKRFLEEI